MEQKDYYYYLEMAEKIRIPKYFYHATYKPLLKKIKISGLDTSISKKNWEDSKKGVVYLALDPDVAESYAETNDVVSEDWLDQIIILKIDASKLNQEKIKSDSNVRSNNNDTFEYHGVISWQYISMLKKDEY